MKRKGTRSSFDAKAWKCSCGFINKPTEHMFFNLPAFQCGDKKCKKEFALDFSFCLGHIKVNGKDIVGDALDQERKRYCLAYSYCKAAEITERVACVKNGIDPDTVVKFNAEQLEMDLRHKFPVLSLWILIQSSDIGLLRIVHMGLILRSEGVILDGLNERYVAADVSTVPRDDFELICKSIADGHPLIATYRVGKRKGQLPYCKIYKSPHEDSYGKKEAPRLGHAVVLVGAGMKKGKRFFYFINSWGSRFCARKNKKGDLITSGIGKLRSDDLTKNVIQLHSSEGIGGERRFQDQSMMNISRLNFVLVTARKNQCLPRILQQLRAEDPFGDIEADILSDDIYEDDLQTNFLIDQEDTICSSLNIEADWSGGSSNPRGATTCSHGGCCPPGRHRQRYPSKRSPLPADRARCSLMNDVVPCPTADNAAPTPDACSAVPRRMKGIPNVSMRDTASSPMGSPAPSLTADSVTSAPNAPTAVTRRRFKNGSTSAKAPSPAGSMVPCLTAHNSAHAPHGPSAVPRRMNSVPNGLMCDAASSLTDSAAPSPMADSAAIAPDAGSAVPVPSLLFTLPLMYHDV